MYFQSKVYLNGGAGYVLSKASVSHFVIEGLKGKACKDAVQHGRGEDVNMAFCLTYLGKDLDKNNIRLLNIASHTNITLLTKFKTNPIQIKCKLIIVNTAN